MSVDVKAPEWLHIWQRDAIVAASWSHYMALALDRFRRLRSDAENFTQSRRRHSVGEETGRQETCLATAYGSAVAGALSQEEWEQQTEWYRAASKMLMALPHLLSIVARCKVCTAEIKEQGLADLAIDVAEARTMAAFLKLRSKISAYGESELRRFDRMWEGVNDNGIITSIQNGDDGQVRVDQEGLDSWQRPKERAKTA